MGGDVKMILVKYKGEVWDVLCPKDLVFPNNCIRNVLIQRGKKKVITNRNNIKILYTVSEGIDAFLWVKN